ncbi:MAG: CBS domain-containing protein [Candidatus Zixiibacteriota bacterium]|jgi:CBS domain-containing protein
MDVFIFLTDILGRTVYAGGRRWGRTVDFAADGSHTYPRIGYFVCRPRRGRRRVRVLWEAVDRMEGRGVFLRDGAGAEFEPFERREDEVLLVADLLDRQVVDVNGAKVERVNDVHLLNTDTDLRVVHADTGARGFLRRLGVLRAFDALTTWLFDYKIKEQFINWRFVQPLGEQLGATPVQLNVAGQRLAVLHPADLADIIEDLPQPERAVIFASLDDDVAAEILEEVDEPELAVDLLETVGEERAGDILEEMDPDEAADVLAELDEGKARELIGALDDPELAEDLRELMAQEEGTAGAIMTTEYVEIGRSDPVAEAFKVIKADEDVEAYTYVYVVDEGELIGVISLRDALVAPAETPAGALMSDRVVAAKLDDRPARIFELFGKYGFSALPVVDDERKLRGVIMLYDAVAAMYPDFEKE